MHFSFFLRLFDVFLAHVARILDSDRLLFAGTFVFCCHVQDAVGVDIKRHFDLRHATWSRCDTVERKCTE